jgi:hypothetical protein
MDIDEPAMQSDLPARYAGGNRWMCAQVTELADDILECENAQPIGIV